MVFGNVMVYSLIDMYRYFAECCKVSVQHSVTSQMTLIIAMGATARMSDLVIQINHQPDATICRPDHEHSTTVTTIRR